MKMPDVNLLQLTYSILIKEHFQLYFFPCCSHIHSYYSYALNNTVNYFYQYLVFTVFCKFIEKKMAPSVVTIHDDSIALIIMNVD